MSDNLFGGLVAVILGAIFVGCIAMIFHSGNLQHQNESACHVICQDHQMISCETQETSKGIKLMAVCEDRNSPTGYTAQGVSK